jgi:integrase/recombinase XerD
MGLASDAEFVPHCLRHTFASALLRKTGNLVLVQRALGHASIKTTTRYAHMSDKDLEEAMLS